jgi:CYTH domain-containing protein/thymidylate kinase
MANSKAAIPVIVSTGGPCGGKSTLMPLAKQWLENHGYLVGILCEGATELITGGLPPFGIWDDNLTFQEHLLEYQLAREDRYLRMLADRSGNKPRVLLCDRGAIDSMAYTGRNGFLEVLRRTGHTLPELRSRYTAVIHLMSAARGAPAFYTLANNSARSETPEQAALIDEKIEQAWLGHPHFTVVDNQTAFDDKVRRALAAFSRVLHMPEPLEVERKYFVTDYMIPENHVAVEIQQTYLTGTAEERRVRKRTLDGVSTYFYTTKRDTDTPGVRIETEHEVDLGRYEQLLTERDPHLQTIHKTRYCFAHAGRHLELDVFRGHLTGLVLVEAEIAHIDDPVNLPGHWNVIDVTGNKEFSNKRLAERQNYSLVEFRREAVVPGYTQAIKEWLS